MILHECTTPIIFSLVFLKAIKEAIFAIQEKVDINNSFHKHAKKYTTI
jgi:hypothetical protein